MASTSFGKREREKKKRERAEEKRQRRADRAENPIETEAPDADALMERFRVISEAYESGSMKRENFEAERKEIYEALGMGDTFE